MKKNIKTKTHNLYKIVFLFVVFLGIGYAFLEANLNINGDVTVEAPELNVYISSVTQYDGYTYDIGTSSIVGNEKHEYDLTATIPIAHSMEEVDNYDDYGHADTLTIVNKGSKDAYISDIDLKVYDSNGNLVNINRDINTYGDLGITIQYRDAYSKVSQERRIPAGSSIEISAFTDIILDPNTTDNEVTYTYKFTFDVEEDLFSKDSWSTIISNVQNGTIPDYYKVGAIKPITLNIDLDKDGTPEERTYDLRIANISTPAECSTQGFSQTACGFVLEFVKGITPHVVNSSTSGSGNGIGNRGGWEYSEIRSFVNGDIYNLIPSELKDGIIETRVVSGHGSLDANNFTTQDYLYLPSPKEVWNADTSVDTAANNTRQFDYYASKGVVVDQTQKDGALGPVTYKKTGYISSDPYTSVSPEGSWWTRTAKAGSINDFNSSFAGDLNYSNVSWWGYAVSPAFRIG